MGENSIIDADESMFREGKFYINGDYLGLEEAIKRCEEILRGYEFRPERPWTDEEIARHRAFVERLMPCLAKNPFMALVDGTPFTYDDPPLPNDSPEK